MGLHNGNPGEYVQNICTFYAGIRNGSVSSSYPKETKQLDIVQNQVLRIITGRVKITPITAMEIYTGIEPLKVRRDRAVMQ
jgi:hypothetical protein